MNKPTYVEIEPTNSCNLRCRMCHVSFEKKKKPTFLDLSAVDFDFFKNARVSIGATYEPTIHPEFNSLLHQLNKVNAKISLITNAKNLNRKNIPAIFDSDLERVTFSFDGISKYTYEHIRRNGNFDQTLENIEDFITKIRCRQSTHFSVNNTVMKHNLMEVGETPKFWDKFGVNHVGFIRMQIRQLDQWMWENSLWQVRDVFYSELEKAAASILTSPLSITMGVPESSGDWNLRKKFDAPDGFISASPEKTYLPSIQSETQYGRGFGTTFPCKSPFVSMRLLWDGSVKLCHNFYIGNVKRNTLQSIWNGPKAELLREIILKDKTNRVCNGCDYFRLCINYTKASYDDISTYFSGPMLSELERRGFAIKAQSMLT